MEFSEAFRAEDISKTDFFDFVVTPEDMGNDIVLHNNFPWPRKSMGLFAANNNNNNGDAVHPVNAVNAVVDGPGLAKEANNNILPGFGDDSFWENAATTKAAFAAAAAALNVKMESPTLEDINEICWSSNGCVGTPESDARIPDKDDANTDGSIYTLTVVNGQEDAGAPPTPPAWYRPPDLSSILREGDEQLRQAMSAMDPNGQYQASSLDIDSIINILPSLPDSLYATTPESGPGPGPDDSGFAESKEDAQIALKSDSHATPSSSQVHQGPNHQGQVHQGQNHQGQVHQGQNHQGQVHQGQNHQGQGLQEQSSPSDLDDRQQQQQFSENNNDWAFSNNESSAESLLRTALQGGKSFLSQYNGCAMPATPQHMPQDTKTLTELQSGLPPPDHSSLGLFMSSDAMMDSALLFDDSGGGMYSNGPASSASHCMDDILLSPLDDYEKLKMIENEVAESAKRYGGLEPHVAHAANGLGHAPYGGVPVASVPHSSTPPKPKKKSSKKSGDRQAVSKPKTSSSSSSSSSGSGTGLVSSGVGISGQPSSTGPRRERSLHHCTICSKAFKDKYSVNVHIRTHTGEKPFACSVCGKSFRQKAHLAKHYHTHIVQKNEQIPSKPLPTKAR